MKFPSFAEEFGGIFLATLHLNSDYFFSRHKNPQGNVFEMSVWFLCCCWL